MGAGRQHIDGRYRAALYMRLSKDDEKAAESASITAQREMLRAYAAERGYEVYDEYVDDGVSGTTFERPDFGRMLRDIEAGKVNMVVTKDLSRLGRDYILAGQYTEIYFPARRVRFIAVNDGYDSDSPYTDMAPFQNVVNEMYARDTSKKIRSALTARMREGEFVGAFAPYGYRRDSNDRRRLTPDGEAAGVVREIFCLAADGAPPGQIAKILNRRGVMTPLLYRRRKEALPEGADSFQKGEWTSSTISKILKNEVYLGHLVQGKTTKASFKSKETVSKPREDWIVVQDAHEPLVSRETFEAAAVRSAGRACPARGSFVNLFSGIARCADCGRGMSSVGTRRKGAIANLACGGYKLHGAGECTNHFIDYGSLYAVVLDSLRELTALSGEEKEKILEKARGNFLRQETGDRSAAEQKRLKKRAAELERLIVKLYEDYARGLLEEERVNRLLARYESESRDIGRKQKELEAAAARKKSGDPKQKLESALDAYLEITELTPGLLRRLIDHIEIGQGVYADTAGSGRGREKRQSITIYFRFRESNGLKRHPDGNHACAWALDATRRES